MSFKETFLDGLNKVKLTTTEFKPEIWVGVGLLAGAATVVTACMSTTKIEAALEDPKSKIVKAHEVHEGTLVIEEDGEPVEYTDKQYYADLTKLYLRMVGTSLKVYAIPITLGAISVAFILKGHHELRERVAGLAAANMAITQAFNEYRKKVIEEQGEDMDRHFRFGTKIEELVVTETDENGNEVETKAELEKVDLPKIDYARYFDRYTSVEAQGKIDYDLTFLRLREGIFNTQLRTNGALYLADVYDALGIDLEDAPYARQVGWLYDETRDDIDNYVNLRIRVVARDIVVNAETGETKTIRSILIDPNVDGDILKLQWAKFMDKHQLDAVAAGLA